VHHERAHTEPLGEGQGLLVVGCGEDSIGEEGQGKGVLWLTNGAGSVHWRYADGHVSQRRTDGCKAV
jgi:hypothetical protein